MKITAKKRILVICLTLIPGTLAIKTAIEPLWIQRLSYLDLIVFGLALACWVLISVIGWRSKK